jgi:hypothetical protein
MLSEAELHFAEAKRVEAYLSALKSFIPLSVQSPAIADEHIQFSAIVFGPVDFEFRNGLKPATSGQSIWAYLRDQNPKGGSIRQPWFGMLPRMAFSPSK